MLDLKCQGDLFGTRGLYDGGYPPDSEPGYDPRKGGRWLLVVPACGRFRVGR